MSQPAKQLARLRLAPAAAITAALSMGLAAQVQAPANNTLQASQFHALLAMEQACAARPATLPATPCTLIIDTPQTLTLSRTHTLPASIWLRFLPGGLWKVDGAPFRIASGTVEAPPMQRIFSGTSEVLGLNAARPEWFALPTALGYPAVALAQAYRATVPWGTILLNDEAYLSPFEDPETPYDSPRRFVGTTRPLVDDERGPQRLLHGSVILGAVVGFAPLQATHLGIDVGPWVVTHILQGHKPNGIFLPNPGGFNPRRGTELKDISVLSNDQDGQHTVLLEGDDGAVIDGLWIWTPGGTHGLVFKASNSLVRNFHCKGAVADCLLVKSDYATSHSGYAAHDIFDGLDIGYLAVPGDTGGITLDARWDSIDDVSFYHVREDSLPYGINGAGSWFHTLRNITVSNWSSHGMVGPCGMFHRSAKIAIRHFDCELAGALPAAFVVSGRSVSIQDGVIACAEPACASSKADGILDGGEGTTAAGLTGRGLGGFLLARESTATHGAYSHLQLDCPGRLLGDVPARHRSVSALIREFIADLKPHLRMLWVAFVTAFQSLWRWLFSKLKQHQG